jgi:purine-binding chemotaxis protein CheW
MADARKRARAREGAPETSEPEASPVETAPGAPRSAALPPPEAPAAPPPPAPPSARPAAPPPPAASAEPDGARIQLPSSGLASEILAREELRHVAAEPAAAPAPVEPAPAPASPSLAAQSLSFFAAPLQEHRATAEATEHMATFLLDREEYGVDVQLVQEIRRVAEITVVPRAPGYVRGVINLRGRILPVIDLKSKLALGEVAHAKEARIVVVRLRERLLGLLVDGASQVLKVPVSRIEPPPEEVVDKGGEYIRGVAKLENRLVILIDLERVLSQELREAAAVGVQA